MVELSDIILYKESNQYYNSIKFRILVPIDIESRELKMGDTIGYNNLVLKLDNSLSVTKWNRLIQEETDNCVIYPLCTERKFCFVDIGFQNYKLYGQLANTIKLYKYIWDNEYNRYLDETKQIYIDKGILLTQDPMDLFLIIPLKYKIDIVS